jgi:hypothetical protein
MGSFLSLRRRRLALPGCILVLRARIYSYRTKVNHDRFSEISGKEPPGC